MTSSSVINFKTVSMWNNNNNNNNNSKCCTDKPQNRYVDIVYYSVSITLNWMEVKAINSKWDRYLLTIELFAVDNII